MLIFKIFSTKSSNILTSWTNTNSAENYRIRKIRGEKL